MDGLSRRWSLLSRARVSRRRVLAGGAAGASIAAALAVAGCGRSGNGQATPAGEQPRRGGTLHTGTTLPLSSGLDPQIEQGTGLTIFPRIYGYTVHVNPDDDSLLYDHAESVEQPEATTYIFKLRDGIRFQDVPPVSGRTVTSEDVAASLLRYRDNPLVVSKTWFTSVLDHIETPEATTVVVKTARPNAYSLSELGGIAGGAIIPKELVESYADLSTSGVGSGPFRIDSVSVDNDVRVVRHDGYFGAPLPYLDAMEWLIMSDDEVKAAAFQTQQLDVVPNHDKLEAERFAAFSPDVEVTSEPALAYLSLGLRTDRAPFNDARVREAVDMTIDRDVLIRDIAFGEGAVPGPVNPHLAGGYWALPPDEIGAGYHASTPIERRRADARAMIEEAGAAGARVRLQVPKLPQLLDVATVVRDHLQQAGLVVDLETLDRLAWFVNFRRGEFEATLISHAPYETPDIPTRLYHSKGIDGIANPFGFADPSIDALVERSWGETDRETRRRRLLEAQRLMVQARPMVHLLTNTAYTSAWRYVRDLNPGAPGSLAQYNYGQWLARG